MLRKQIFELESDNKELVSENEKQQATIYYLRSELQKMSSFPKDVKMREY
jgi:predicted RNase H-like nuclease (RuvC/YqgF family)